LLLTLALVKKSAAVVGGQNNNAPPSVSRNVMCYMRSKYVRLLFFFSFFICKAYGQSLVANTCDSVLLTKQEYEKCKLDSVWMADIVVKVNYITNFKTFLLPKYRVIRKKQILPPTLQKSLQDLKVVYNSVLGKKLSVFEAQMDKGQKYVQPKAYLSSLLSLQIFKFYPDCHAILLNDIHLELMPKTTISEKEKYYQYFEKVLNLIPKELYKELITITSDFASDNTKLMKEGFSPLFQGSIQEGYRTKCNIVNFLLWTE
jgi:hypothetical protein